MPERKTVQQAEEKKRRGRAPSTQAGEFVREEIHHIRAGKHGARSTKQAIAIGLSKARRAGVQVPKKGGSRSQNSPDSSTSNRSHNSSRSTPLGRRESSPRRARATLRALQRESRGAASHRALARQGRQAARQRSSADRSASARQAARTKGAAGRSAAARKAARTRAAT